MIQVNWNGHAGTGMDVIPVKHEDPLYPYQCLVVLICSAKSSDATLLSYMEAVFKLYDINPTNVNNMPDVALEWALKKLGRQSQNAKHIKQATAKILKDYDGEVPRDYKELLKFDGVGPKIASLLMWELTEEAFAAPVDIHVIRQCNILGWSQCSLDAHETCRAQIEKLIPQKYWVFLHKLCGCLGQLFHSSRYAKIVMRIAEKECSPKVIEKLNKIKNAYQKSKTK